MLQPFQGPVPVIIRGTAQFFGEGLSAAAVPEEDLLAADLADSPAAAAPAEVGKKSVRS